MKYLSSTLALLAASTVICTSASAAEIVYNVSDFTGGKHGLWTNKSDEGADRYYSIEDGTTFTVDTDTMTAVLAGTAKNASGTIAVLDLTFGGFLENLNGTSFTYKKENGVSYNAATDSPDIDFYSTATGTITVGGNTFALNSTNPFAGGHLFQIGTGANAKSVTDFGASSWLIVDGQQSHWDINVQLSAAVPEPATWAMLLFGFFAVGGMMRSQKYRQEIKLNFA